MTAGTDILFIVNPICGKGRNAAKAEWLRSKGFDVVITRYAGEAAEIAASATQDIVVAVGGDGTVNEVARALASRISDGGKTPSLGIIPCGSGDGLALSLGISRNKEKALRTVLGGKRRKLDCGRIDSHYFFSVCGIGLDAMVSEAFAKAGSRGLWTYIRMALRIWRNFTPGEYSVCIDGEVHEFKAVLITVANSRQWGNGARIAPLADVSDSLLDISVIDMFRSLEIPGLVWRLMTGRLQGSSHFKSFRGRNVSISRNGYGPAHFDGDFFTAGPKVEISLLDGQLDVIC